MLIKPTIDELDNLIESRYVTVILASKRAHDLRKGLPAITDEEERNPISQAAKEISKELIKPKYPKDI